MAGTPTRERLEELRQRRAELLERCEGLCLEARAEGRETLTAAESDRLRRMSADLRDLDAHIEQYAEDVARVGDHPIMSKISRAMNSGNRVAPINFDVSELRRAHDRLRRGEAVRIEARDLGYTTATPDLPPSLAPWVTELQHEGRILDRLPAYALDAPSIEIIQVNSVTGAAGIVDEGVAKPEIVPEVTPLTVTAKKLAAHTGLSYEAVADFDAFSNYCRIELQRQVILTENTEILYGDCGTGHLNGFFGTTGILLFDASTADQDLDAVESAIATLRVGPALATPDLLVLHPSTFSSIRKLKDLQDRYLLNADPSAAEASSIWGIPVVQTTACHEGDGLLVDTTKYGRAVVREPLSMRIGFANDDFVRNILRTVCEERLNNAVERPKAILWLKNLGVPPVAARAVSKK